MNIRDLVNRLDIIENVRLDETAMADILAAVKGTENDEAKRFQILAQLAQKYQVPGLYDPIGGGFVTNQGQKNMFPASKDVDYMLASKGLLPRKAQTSSMFGRLTGYSGDEYDQGIQSMSQKVDADAGSEEFVQQHLKAVYDLTDKLEATLTAPKPATPTGSAALDPAKNPNPATNIPGGPGVVPSNTTKSGQASESISISKSLLESFGYEDNQIDEYSMQDFGNDVSDTARGAEQGLTFGFGNNINAGVKSLWNGTKYKDELSKEYDADAAAQARSPNLYKAGEYTGMAAPFLIPGAGMASAAIRGAGKLGARELAALAAKKAASAGAKAVANPGATAAGAAKFAGKTGLGVGGFMAADAGRKAIDAAQLASGGDQKLAQLQQTMGLKPDGKLTPQTKQAIISYQQQYKLKPTGIPDAATYNFAGISESKPQSLAESIASLRDRLAEIETAKPETHDIWVYLDESTNTLYDEEGYEILNAEEYLRENVLFEKAGEAAAVDSALDRAAPGLASRWGNYIQSGLRNGWNKLSSLWGGNAEKAAAGDANAAKTTTTTPTATPPTGAPAGAPVNPPVGTIVKDAQSGINYKWEGGRWEPETKPGSGRYNMHGKDAQGNRVDSATLGKGKTNAQAEALHKQYQAEYEAASKKPGGAAAWIKANPKKAAAIGLITAGAIGGATLYANSGSDGNTNTNPNTSTTTTTTTPSTDKPPEQAPLATEPTPDQLELIRQLQAEMQQIAELGGSHENEIARANSQAQRLIDKIMNGKSVPPANTGAQQGAMPSTTQQQQPTGPTFTQRATYTPTVGDVRANLAANGTPQQ